MAFDSTDQEHMETMQNKVEVLEEQLFLSNKRVVALKTFINKVIEEGEDSEVVRWTHNGTKYLVDSDNGDIYDAVKYDNDDEIVKIGVREPNTDEGSIINDLDIVRRATEIKTIFEIANTIKLVVTNEQYIKIMDSLPTLFKL